MMKMKKENDGMYALKLILAMLVFAGCWIISLNIMKNSASALKQKTINTAISVIEEHGVTPDMVTGMINKLKGGNDKDELDEDMFIEETAAVEGYDEADVKQEGTEGSIGDIENTSESTEESKN